MHQTLVSRSDLAHLLGLSDARVTQLVHNETLPRPAKRGRYDLGASVKAYVSHLKTATHRTLAVERTRLTRARADQAELVLRLRQGELVEVQAVKRDAFKAARMVRDNLLSLPDRLAGIVSSEADQTKNHALLTRELRQALEALADTSIQGALSE